jgi:hypothetical protein
MKGLLMTAPAWTVPAAMMTTPRKRAALIIADNMDAGSRSRVTLINKYLNMIADANDKAPMFSDVCLNFHASEVKTPSSIFKTARDKGIGIIADTLNANYRDASSYSAYVDHVKRLQDQGVTLLRVDDANTLPSVALQSMIVDLPGLRWILSSGVHAAPAMSSLALAQDADTKVTVQGYLNGADVSYLKKWLKDIPMWSLDFECYRTGKGRMTTTAEIATMGQAVIEAHKKVVMVYGHDDNTDFTLPATNPRNVRAQWNALQTWLREWWAKA